MEPYLNIGEMSRLFGLNVQTLRYYDKIGLFVPECRAGNNYRSYRFEQCYQLAAICHMRRLGYPLARIAEILALRNVQKSEREMEHRLETVRQEQQRLAEMERVMRRKLAFLRGELALWEGQAAPTIRHFLERYYLPIGGEDMLYKDEFFYLNPTMVLYDSQATRSFCSYLGERPPEPNGAEQAGGAGAGAMPAPMSLPVGRYLCAYHRGSYERIWAFAQTLRAQHARLPLADWSVHFNIIDQFVEKNSDNFLTQVQIHLETR